jgi:hypothetical protein
VVAVGELEDELQFLLVELRLDRAYEAQTAPDRERLADLERLLVTQMTRRDDLVAATHLISVGGHRS